MPKLKEKKTKVKNSEPKQKSEHTCIVCGSSAEFCMRGIPENKYCKECAKDYFKLLSYLDKLK